MQRLAFRLFALCLALLWVPAMAHCRMEALGFEFAACAEGCHGDEAERDASSNACSDACMLLEDGLYKSGVDPVKVAPTTWVVAFLARLHVPEPDPDTGPVALNRDRGRPQEWIAQWRFVRRAVAPAHAPDLSLA